MFWPLDGFGKVVESDKTYFGPTDERRRLKKLRAVPYTTSGMSGPANKRATVALVEHGGNVRTFHVQTADRITVSGIVKENISRESRLRIDASHHYAGDDQHLSTHESMKHSAGEYVCGDMHTNSADYFSSFKSGMRGLYKHCKEKHLHRYLAEFVFRYNHRIDLGYSNIGRTHAAIEGVEGKRLMYRQPR